MASTAIWYFKVSNKKGSLQLRYVQTHGALPEWRGARWMAQLVSAVGYMHSRGFAHRDLKLENVVISHDSVKLTDFGFSRRVCREQTRLGFSWTSTRARSSRALSVDPSPTRRPRFFSERPTRPSRFAV